jgi:hypothetical protein
MSFNWSKVALWLSGSFCCGAVNHTFAGVQGRTETPYGIHLGVTGNWALFAFDLMMTVLLLWLHRRLEWGRTAAA